MKAALVSPLSNMFYKQLGGYKQLKGWRQKEKKEEELKSHSEIKRHLVATRGPTTWSLDNTIVEVFVDGGNVTKTVWYLKSWAQPGSSTSVGSDLTLHQWRRAFVTFEDSEDNIVTFLRHATTSIFHLRNRLGTYYLKKISTYQHVIFTFLYYRCLIETFENTVLW